MDWPCTSLKTVNVQERKVQSFKLKLPPRFVPVASIEKRREASTGKAGSVSRSLAAHSLPARKTSSITRGAVHRSRRTPWPEPSLRVSSRSIDDAPPAPSRESLGFIQNLDSGDRRIIHDWFKGKIQLPLRTGFLVTKGLSHLVEVPALFENIEVV
jgi:hypothetical protein